MTHRRDGYTLIELIMAMLLLAVLLGMAAPALARWRDLTSVVAARDELAGRLAWTRMAAASRGGAALVIDLREGRCWTRFADGEATPPVELSGRWGVELRSPPAADSVVLWYDALGIGRGTSRTLEVRRGDAVAGLTVAAYGRFRRW